MLGSQAIFSWLSERCSLNVANSCWVNVGGRPKIILEIFTAVLHCLLPRVMLNCLEIFQWALPQLALSCYTVWWSCREPSTPHMGLGVRDKDCPKALPTWASCRKDLRLAVLRCIWTFSWWSHQSTLSSDCCSSFQDLHSTKSQVSCMGTFVQTGLFAVFPSPKPGFRGKQNLLHEGRLGFLSFLFMCGPLISLLPYL